VFKLRGKFRRYPERQFFVHELRGKFNWYPDRRSSELTS
jgi:hypothetical protein